MSFINSNPLSQGVLHPLKYFTLSLLTLIHMFAPQYSTTIKLHVPKVTPHITKQLKSTAN